MNEDQYITFIAFCIIFGSGLIAAGLVTMGKEISERIKDWWDGKT